MVEREVRNTACICCVHWNHLFIHRPLELRLQLWRLNHVEGNSWWEFGTLLVVKGNGRLCFLRWCVRGQWALSVGSKMCTIIQILTAYEHLIAWENFITFNCHENFRLYLLHNSLIYLCIYLFYLLIYLLIYLFIYLPPTELQEAYVVM
jgi:hypothetical protein